MDPEFDNFLKALMDNFIKNYDYDPEITPVGDLEAGDLFTVDLEGPIIDQVISRSEVRKMSHKTYTPEFIEKMLKEKDVWFKVVYPEGDHGFPWI